MLADAADSKKLTAAKNRLKAAEKELAAIESGEYKYEPIRGAKKALESPAHKDSDYGAAYSPRSTGRRLALARWITSNQNPLTARVAVNHVWSRHFGTPLVESVFDFGLRAKQPLHAQLLDFLAAELMESGWSLQHLHRLMVTSRAYRMTSSSLGGGVCASLDPTNQYYWRMNSRRMESQIVRDSLLHFAGRLDARLGGPSIDPNPNATRRSLYFKHSRDQQDKFLGMFDDADVLQCYRRSESIVPQQALALSNSSLSIKMSSSIEQRIWSSLDSQQQSAFIDAVFLLLLARHATTDEHRECDRFFAEMAALAADQPSDQQTRRIRTRFVQAMLNHNDFITIR
jgi:hypothetical protein